MMIDEYLQIFYQTCLSLIPIIPAIIGIWLLFDLLGGLIFNKR
jgi:uncharacterized membrane protein YesL